MTANGTHLTPAAYLAEAQEMRKSMPTPEEVSREAFEAYWSERQRITHPYTDREVPEGWGAAFKPDAWKAWQASHQAAMEQAAQAVEDSTSYDGYDPASTYAEAIRALIAKPAEGE